MNKQAFWILLLFIGWSYMALGWYTCGIKGFCERAYEVAPQAEIVTMKKDSRECIPYINDHMKMGVANNPVEVEKLQNFLNDTRIATLEVDGVYSQITSEAVKVFQMRYSDEVLKESWGINHPTGMVFSSTKKKINELYCMRSPQEIDN